MAWPNWLVPSGALAECMLLRAASLILPETKQIRIVCSGTVLGAMGIMVSWQHRHAAMDALIAGSLRWRAGI
eukprot:2023233-Alexandrium_andersonii.AAC.1